MAGVALVLIGLWGLVAFGWRTVVQRRRTGDSGFRGGRDRPGTAAWWASVGFGVALFLTVAGPVADVTGVPPVASLDHPAVAAAGVLLAVAGLAATVVAQGAMGRSWRIGVDQAERTDLVTAGPFRLVRNPIFTTMTATNAGLAAMVPNIMSLAGLVTLVAALELQVRAVEEPYLLRTHWPAYADYAARVGRFVPGAGRLRLAQPATPPGDAKQLPA